MPNLRLNLVVAACNNNGIGIHGKLPWNLRKDMDFFKKITSETKVAGRQNAVIMGRKTWFSIPEKFRPLKGRINIVLSREMKETPTGVHVCRSLQEAVDLVSQPQIDGIELENVYVIGGSSVYQESMSGAYPCRLYLTRVLAEFDCDTFLPTLDDSFVKVEKPTDIPTTEIQEEKGIQFRFEVYDKKYNQRLTMAGNGGPIKSTKTNDKNEPIKFNIMAAMCSENRGIGYQGNLPWPKLSKDFEYYCRMTSTLRNTEAEDKFIVHIQGRLSWEGSSIKERDLKSIRRVIISAQHPEKVAQHPSILKIVPSFEAAMDFCQANTNKIDSIWIMGGANVDKAALEHRLCDRLYLTRVYADYPADVFFPEFESSFIETSDEVGDGGIIEENGVKYEFKVYKKTMRNA